jgi:hypothetical protein
MFPVVAIVSLGVCCQVLLVTPTLYVPATGVEVRPLDSDLSPARCARTARRLRDGGKKLWGRRLAIIDAVLGLRQLDTETTLSSSRSRTDSHFWRGPVGEVLYLKVNNEPSQAVKWHWTGARRNSRSRNSPTTLRRYRPGTHSVQLLSRNGYGQEMRMIHGRAIRRRSPRMSFTTLHWHAGHRMDSALLSSGSRIPPRPSRWVSCGWRRCPAAG